MAINQYSQFTAQENGLKGRPLGEGIDKESFVLNLDGVDYVLRVEENKLLIEDFDFENEELAMMLSGEKMSMEYHVLKVMDNALRRGGGRKKLKRMVDDFNSWKKKSPIEQKSPPFNTVNFAYMVHKGEMEERWDSCPFKCDPLTLAFLADSPTVSSRCWAAINPLLGAKYKRKLFLDKDYGVFRAVLGGNRFPREWCEEIVLGENFSKLIWVIEDRDTPSHVLAEFVEKLIWRIDNEESKLGEPKHYYGVAFKALAENPHTPLSSLIKYFERLPSDALVAILERRVSKSLRSRIINHPEEIFRADIAHFAKLSYFEQQIYLKDSLVVRLRLASNKNLDARVLKALKSENNFKIDNFINSVTMMKSSRFKDKEVSDIVNKFLHEMWWDLEDKLFRLLAPPLIYLLENFFIRY